MLLAMHGLLIIACCVCQAVHIVTTIKRKDDEAYSVSHEECRRGRSDLQRRWKVKRQEGHGGEGDRSYQKKIGTGEKTRR